MSVELNIKFSFRLVQGYFSKTLHISLLNNYYQKFRDNYEIMTYLVTITDFDH